MNKFHSFRIRVFYGLENVKYRMKNEQRDSTATAAMAAGERH